MREIEYLRFFGLKKPLAVNELSIKLSLEGVNMSVNLLAHESSVFIGKRNLSGNIRQNSDKNQDNEAIFTCSGFSVAIIWSQNSVFLFDFHGQNADNFHESNEHVILSKFGSIISLNN